MKTLRTLAILLIGGAAGLRAADVDLYAVTKAQSFTQTSPAAPVLLATGGFIFVSIVSPHATGSVSSATLKLPDLTVKNFGPVAGIGPLAVAGTFDTQDALDAVYGSGSYAFTINAVTDGTKTPSLSLTGSSYPNTPTITNFDAAQNIDWTQPFTLSWGTFVGGNFLDNIQVIVRRKNGTQIFATPAYGSPGTLDGTATSTVIPANTLVPGESYTASLYFGNIIAVNFLSYPGVPGVTAFIKTTEFPMKVPGTPPFLTIAKGTSPNSFDLTWTADVGRTYDLRWSEDFVSWTQLALVTAGTATETRTDTPGSGVPQRFYRLQEPP